ncbi:MAG: hypothetical protein IKP86_08975 [Anaerolineaceae bacterium]|nr:hypothetical protein [Anaerolineaceae bacterium]
MSTMLLKIVTADGVNRSIGCDSINLWMAPDSSGKGEGSLGIRKDHTEAVIALGNGPLTAYQDGKPVFTARTEGGFATVFSNTITVISRKLSEK